MKLTEKTGCFTLGLIHVNKSASGDALTTLMASRAFAAVARSVLYAMVDPDNEQTRLLGQIKNNLGRSDLPTLAFHMAIIATYPKCGLTKAPAAVATSAPHTDVGRTGGDVSWLVRSAVTRHGWHEHGHTERTSP